MSIIKTISTLQSPLIIIVVFMLVLLPIYIPEAVYAQCIGNEAQVAVNPGGSDVKIRQDNGNDIYCIPDGDNIDNNAIVVYLKAIIQFLTGGVGLVITLMIIIGGVQYMAASDNPQKVEAAKKRITNAILALVLFIFAVAILNFLVPGGLL